MQLGRKAVSPLIATVLVTLFGVITLGIALGVVNPTFRRAQDTSAVNDQFATLETLNAAVKEVASEPDGSRRVVPITVTAGTLRVNSTYDWLYFEYEPLETLGISGTKGDIRIDQGLEFVDYFSSYADGSTATPVWTNASGQALASSGAYSITNGTAYHNISTLENWKFSAAMSNVSGSTGGQVFALPTNPESLVGFWPLDNRSGSVAYDYSGNHNNGTLTNMNTIGNATSGWQDAANCKAGRSCLRFDGVNDYVNAGSSYNLNITDAITISLWFKQNSYIDSYLVSKGSSYRLKLQDGSRLRGLIYIDGAIKNVYSVTGSILNNTWYHAVMTYDKNDPSNIVKLYINGVNATSSATNTGGLPIDTVTASIYIGDLLNGGYVFNGTIDEVMIFNRSLSADEVAALYETSAKKLSGAGGSQSIAAKTPNPAIVLANPAGQTRVDNVEVTRSGGKLTLMVPYTNVELNGTLRLQKGEHRVQIRHMATNVTTNKPIIELTAV